MTFLSRSRGPWRQGGDIYLTEINGNQCCYWIYIFYLLIAEIWIELPTQKIVIWEKGEFPRETWNLNLNWRQVNCQDGIQFEFKWNKAGLQPVSRSWNSFIILKGESFWCQGLANGQTCRTGSSASCIN